MNLESGPSQRLNSELDYLKFPKKGRIAWLSNRLNLPLTTARKYLLNDVLPRSPTQARRIASELGFSVSDWVFNTDQKLQGNTNHTNHDWLACLKVYELVNQCINDNFNHAITIKPSGLNHLYSEAYKEFLNDGEINKHLLSIRVKAVLSAM